VTRRNTQTYSESVIAGRLAKKFPAPEFAFMTQVGNATGTRTNRHADAIAMSLWPSRGLDLHGFEIKCYRNDFLNEKKNPAKAEAIQQFCNFWWIVTAPGIVQELDIFPPTWGLMEVDGAGLKVKIKAPRQDAKPLTLAMIASLFRSFAETVPQLQGRYVHVDEVKKVVDEKVAEELTRQADRNTWIKQHQELATTVNAFEQASGIKITDRWNQPAQIGAALKVFIDNEMRARAQDRYTYEANGLRRILKSLEELLAHIDAMREGESSAVEALTA
jgi:hypothetical protein